MKRQSVTATSTNPAQKESALMLKISVVVIVLFAVLAWVF